METLEENPLTGSLGRLNNLLPRFPKYGGVKSGMFISLTWRIKNKKSPPIIIVLNNNN